MLSTFYGATFLSVCTDICLAKCRLVCVQPSKKPAGHSYEAVEGLLVEKKPLGWLRVCVCYNLVLFFAA